MARKAHQALPANPSAAVQKRDAALTRVARVRRATIFGAGALTAGLAGVVSAIAPGRTLGAKSKVHPAATATRPRFTASKARMPPLAKPDQLGLQAPAGAPRAAPQPSPQPSQPAPSQSAPPQAAPAAPAPQPTPGPAVSGGS